MGNKRSLFAAFATALLVVGAFSTGVVAVGTQSVDGLAVDVDQSESIVVTVTDDGTAVEGANVTVAPVDENASVGVGEYMTDANGTVTLATPAENVTVDVTAAYDDETATTIVTLLGEQEADEEALAVVVSQTEDVTVHVTDNGTDVANASVTVDAPVVNNSTYAGVGDYATDANGTVDLSAPEENVTVDVTATVGNETASTTATLVDGSEESESFGDRVSTFVETLLSGEDGEEDKPLGQLISEFVTENNPGAENRPDHAGPPAHAGPGGDDDDENDRRGPPEHAGGDEDDDDRRGPPEHAGPGGDDDDETDEEETGEEDDERQASLGFVGGVDF